MNVLSLFGGIETGLIVLKELGVKIDSYYSSEIDRYAASVARFNHPEIIELGDISNYKEWNLPKIDLILAGPPCQGFSIAGKRLNWKDPRSLLFFKAIELIWDLKPKYFMVENVGRMKKEIVAEINELLEIDSVRINSNLVSAQNRDRNYWCNLKVKQPEDKGILLKDIIEDGFSDRSKSLCIDSNYYKTSESNPDRYLRESGRQIVFKCGLEQGRRLFDGKNLSRNFREGYRVYCGTGKSGTLTANSKGGLGGYSGLYEIMSDIRKLTVNECERLQTLPDNYTQKGTNKKGELVKISDTQRYKAIGNGWTKDVIKHILQGIL